MASSNELTEAQMNEIIEATPSLRSLLALPAGTGTFEEELEKRSSRDSAGRRWSQEENALLWHFRRPQHNISHETLKGLFGRSAMSCRLRLHHITQDIREAGGIPVGPAPTGDHRRERGQRPSGVSKEDRRAGPSSRGARRTGRVASAEALLQAVEGDRDGSHASSFTAINRAGAGGRAPLPADEEEEGEGGTEEGKEEEEEEEDWEQTSLPDDRETEASPPTVDKTEEEDPEVLKAANILVELHNAPWPAENRRQASTGRRRLLLSDILN